MKKLDLELNLFNCRHIENKLRQEINSLDKILGEKKKLLYLTMKEVANINSLLTKKRKGGR